MIVSDFIYSCAVMFSKAPYWTFNSYTRGNGYLSIKTGNQRRNERCLMVLRSCTHMQNSCTLSCTSLESTAAYMMSIQPLKVACVTEELSEHQHIQHKPVLYYHHM